MVTEVRREDVPRLMAQDAQLVDVLPREQYEQEHIAGAISIPLARFPAELDRLHPGRAVIVYCYDYQ